VRNEAGYARRRKAAIEKETANQVFKIKSLSNEPHRIHYIETIGKFRKEEVLKYHNKMVEAYGKAISALRDVSMPMCRALLAKRREGTDITAESLSESLPVEVYSKIASEMTDLKATTESFKNAVAMDTAFAKALASLQEGH
jgi:hypothetical protein